MNKKDPLISSILSEIKSELEIDFLVEPVHGYAGRIITKDRKIFYFKSTKFDINGLGSSEIAQDKAYASYFMNKLGYPVPVGESFYSAYWCKRTNSPKNTSAAVKFAEKIKYPVIVKPNSESQGRGVEKVYTQKDLLGGLSFIFNELKDDVALVQAVAKGNDYRIVVLKDEVLCAYLRVPLSLSGNGKRTIFQLLEDKQTEFIKRGRNTIIETSDPRITRSLYHQNLKPNTILPKGQTIQLLSNANLSSGGEALDITAQLHPTYKKMAIKLTHEMGLTFCGVDIMTASPIDKPLNEYVIIEINASPGLDYYAESGEKQKKIVKKLYKKLILSLIKN